MNMGMYLAWSMKETKPVLPRFRWSPFMGPKGGWVIVNWGELFQYNQALTSQGQKTYLDHYILPADDFMYRRRKS